MAGPAVEVTLASTPLNPSTPNLTLLDRLASVLATGAGAGLSSWAPGTLGSLEGVLLFLAYSSMGRAALDKTPIGLPTSLSIINLLVFAIGVWAANRVCRLTGLEDPQKVVIDEINGQMIALTPVVVSPTVAAVIVGFVLFRTLDILKPYPIRRLERLHGGLGVMADDALAGIFSAAFVWAGRHFGLI